MKLLGADYLGVGWVGCQGAWVAAMTGALTCASAIGGVGPTGVNSAWCPAECGDDAAASDDPLIGPCENSIGSDADTCEGLSVDLDVAVGVIVGVDVAAYSGVCGLALWLAVYLAVMYAANVIGMSNASEVVCGAGVYATPLGLLSAHGVNF